MPTTCTCIDKCVLQQPVLVVYSKVSLSSRAPPTCRLSIHCTACNQMISYYSEWTYSIYIARFDQCICPCSFSCIRNEHFLLLALCYTFLIPTSLQLDDEFSDLDDTGDTPFVSEPPPHAPSPRSPQGSPPSPPTPPPPCLSPPVQAGSPEFSEDEDEWTPEPDSPTIDDSNMFNSWESDSNEEEEGRHNNGNDLSFHQGLEQERRDEEEEGEYEEEEVEEEEEEEEEEEVEEEKEEEVEGIEREVEGREVEGGNMEDERGKGEGEDGGGEVEEEEEAEEDNEHREDGKGLEKREWDTAEVRVKEEDERKAGFDEARRVEGTAVTKAPGTTLLMGNEVHEKKNYFPHQGAPSSLHLRTTSLDPLEDGDNDLSEVTPEEQAESMALPTYPIQETSHMSEPVAGDGTWHHMGRALGQVRINTFE